MSTYFSLHRYEFGDGYVTVFTVITVHNSTVPAVRFLSSSTQYPALWREALLFVALAKLGEVFGLLAELRYWAALGALPAPFDRLSITPLSQLGASGRACALDEAVQVLDDWRQERGLTWADVLPQLTVRGHRCERTDFDCERPARPAVWLFCDRCIFDLQNKQAPGVATDVATAPESGCSGSENQNDFGGATRI